jgi:hypothetical protein
MAIVCFPIWKNPRVLFYQSSAARNLALAAVDDRLRQDGIANTMNAGEIIVHSDVIYIRGKVD